MPEPIAFSIAGVPVGKGRPRVYKKPDGSLGQPYTPDKTRTWEGICRSAALDAMHGRAPLAGPLSLELVFHFPIPQSWPAWKQEMALRHQVMHTTKPDRDNCEKAVKDALNGVAWRDDCYIVTGATQKKYSDRPRVDVLIEPLAALPAQCKRRDG